MTFFSLSHPNPHTCAALRCPRPCRPTYVGARRVGTRQQRCECGGRGKIVIHAPLPQNIFGASRLVTVDAEPCWKRCASPSSQPEGTLCRKAKAPLRPCVRLSLLPTRSAGATCPTSEAGAASRRCNAGCPHQ